MGENGYLTSCSARFSDADDHWAAAINQKTLYSAFSVLDLVW